jgi:hypothetical protein
MNLHMRQTIVPILNVIIPIYFFISQLFLDSF